MFLILSNKVEKCSCIRSVNPSVCPSVQALTLIKYSSNVLKLIYIIHAWHGMNHIENGTYATNGLSLTAYGGKMFKAHFNIFSCTNYNEICIGHSHSKKHVSYKKKKWCKKIKYCVYRLTQNFSDALHPMEGSF